MNKIIQILLSILFIQVSIFLYVKFIYEKNLSFPSLFLETQTQEIQPKPTTQYVTEYRELPQSQEYTVWDKKMIAKLNKEIEIFNANIQKIVEETTLPMRTIETKIAVKKPEKTPKTETPKIAAKKVPKVMKKVAKAKPSTSLKITRFAKQKLGKKYVWGATGPNTFDCSGFTREVFKSTTGIKIPRVSRDQAKVGTYVKFSELKRGDMVFFDTEKKYTGKVTHVGIYLSNNNFIHASSAGKKVIITNFKQKPFYKKRFLWGRRIVNTQS